MRKITLTEAMGLTFCEGESYFGSGGYRADFYIKKNGKSIKEELKKRGGLKLIFSDDNGFRIKECYQLTDKAREFLPFEIKGFQGDNIGNGRVFQDEYLLVEDF